MKSYRIYITRQIPEAGISLLIGNGYPVEVISGDESPSKHLLLEKIKDCDALIPLLSDTIDREVIDAAPNLKVIANYAAGFNNIDVAYARSRGIIVTNTPDILNAATADLTWALILAVSKRIVEGDQFTRAGKFSGWSPMLLLGGDVSGKTLGIIGAGRIGQAVARRAKGFDMSVLYYDVNRSSDFERETMARFAGFPAIMSESDFLSIHCPLTEQSRHLINLSNIWIFKKGAYLINTARGPVVEERALIAALKNGILAGAGLDVYEFEPQISEELLSMTNVVLLPHIGSATLETRSEMARMAARNVISVLEKGVAINPVP